MLPMFKCIDILGREIKVGDIVRHRDWQYGTPMKVVGIDLGRLFLKMAHRGRKVHVLHGCRGWHIVSR